ncbi:MAG: choice-of-anchor C family protein [Bradyrhizobium sp.]|uniref:choice-of-anchor C family protein n=1 Tax=Bradyrhizobium sp. TaxID=376 RepID=UPI0025C19600|nr:choice-of-anchor C family protein [Bradyrhizobium sp.]MBI5263418.1 choice-of-anchor C family protein [Bradyrhizobium sp.]
MKRSLLIAPALLAVLWAGSASALTLIQNGSFESGLNDAGPGGYKTIPGSGAVITGWTVGGSVDWINGYWQASDGTHSVDLNGGSIGDIQQAITTVVGQQYLLTFDLSANPDHLDSHPDTRGVYVSAGGPSTLFTYTFDAPPNSKANMNWQTYSLIFTATGTSTLIDFASNVGQNCCWGAALDNVAVTAVPEASTWVMMILGFFGLGYLAHRQRRPALRMA